MTLPSKAELLRLFEGLTDAITIVDVETDLVTAANPAARDQLGIVVGRSAAETSFTGPYLSLSSIAAAGLVEIVSNERVSHRGRAFTVRTVELPTDSEATVAVILRDRTAAETALAEQRIRERLDLARSIARGLVTRLLDPCVVLSADLEYIEQSAGSAEHGHAVAEARDGLAIITRTVTALRELALPDDAADAAPIAPAIEAAVALAGPELLDFAELETDVAPGAATSASRPLLALMAFHLVWWVGDRLRAAAREGTVVHVSVTSDDARITLKIAHAATPLETLEGAEAEVLLSMVSAAGGHVVEGGTDGAAWIEIQLPAAPSRSSHRLPAIDMLVAPTAGAVSASDASPAKRRRLLLVDDDDSIRTALRRLLRHDYDIVLAADVHSAIAAMEDALPDVIVSDVAMPGTSGPALLHLATSRWPQLQRRFLFLTGGSMDVETQRTILAAKVPCLLKPVSRTRLVEAIEDILGTS